MALRQRKTNGGQDFTARRGVVLVCRSLRAALFLCFFILSPQALAWATRTRERGERDRRLCAVRVSPMLGFAASLRPLWGRSSSSLSLLPSLAVLRSARLQSFAILSLRSQRVMCGLGCGLVRLVGLLLSSAGLPRRSGRRRRQPETLLCGVFSPRDLAARRESAPLWGGGVLGEELRSSPNLSPSVWLLVSLGYLSIRVLAAVGGQLSREPLGRVSGVFLGPCAPLWGAVGRCLSPGAVVRPGAAGPPAALCVPVDNFAEGC